MDETLVRRLPRTESFMLDLDDGGLNMTFHYYLRLDRRPLLSDLDQGLRRAVALHPGVNVKFRRGAWYVSDFLPSCATEQVDDIYSRRVKLDYRRHTVALNALCCGEVWYLCFDFFHGVVDGRSALQFVYDFFALLRGEAPEASDCSLIYNELVFPPQGEKKKFYLPFRGVCIPKERKQGREGQQQTVLVRSEAAPGAMAARLARAVGTRFSGKETRVAVPVDLRWLEKEEKKRFGNLILPIVVDGSETDLEKLHQEVRSKAKDRSMLTAIAASVQFYHWLPVPVRKVGVALAIRLFRLRKRHGVAAIVSPVGKVEPEKLRCEKFVTEDMSASFTDTPFEPFTIVALQFGGHTNTTVTCHRGTVSDLCLRQLVRALDQSVTEDAYAKRS